LLGSSFGVRSFSGLSRSGETARLSLYSELAWYECWGIVAPLVLFWWFGRIARRREWRMVERVSRVFICMVRIYLVGAVR